MEGHRNKDAPFVPWNDLSDKVVKDHYSHLVHRWIESGDWAAPKLTKFFKIGEALWEVFVTEAYTD